MTIPWQQFPLVFGVALLSAAVVVGAFALGIRLFATPPRGVTGSGVPRDEELDDVEGPSRPRSATVGGIVSFAVAGGAALYGVSLIVPFLH